MLSNEIKAKIFSLYLGQKVFKYKACDWTDILTPIQLTPIDGEILGQLLLRSVKQLTDGKIINLCHLYYPSMKDSQFEYQSLDWGKGLVKDCMYQHCPTLVTETLRAWGYAIPVTLLVDGAVRTIGVEEMVESGIIKLSE